MLRLDVALPERPDEFRPTLDKDARREDGPEAITLVGDSPLELTLVGELARAPRRRSGISNTRTHGKGGGYRNKTTKRQHRPSNQPAEKRTQRTSLDFVRLGIVSDVRRLGLCDLHEAIFLDLRQRNVGLVPL